MPTRSTRQAKHDDLAYPIRVKIRVPDDGLGKMLDCILAWLRDHCEPGSYACHSAPGIACSTAEFYFLDIDTARSFLCAFPEAELAAGLRPP